MIPRARVSICAEGAAMPRQKHLPSKIFQRQVDGSVSQGHLVVEAAHLIGLTQLPLEILSHLCAFVRPSKRLHPQMLVSRHPAFSPRLPWQDIADL
jgi:hypothetical protein